ncbi:MAG: CBS domain-containing protein [Desulfobulbaceae bacterium]|jgi:CBS domain-containing protein|nr:CBS domain-containing protein [Desulfobulbaceae bacterium]
MKISDLIQRIENREVPAIFEDCTIREVIEMMVRFPHTRLIYVTDTQQRLRGTITVGSLLRHLFPYHYEGKVHGRGILRRITARKASDLMDTKNILARPDEEVDAVLKRMAGSGVKEMAVVDNDGRIVADITAVDLLKFFHLEE